jgi:D-galactarolactone cycloisomerase
MKITDVITHQLSVNVDAPFISSRGWVYKTKGALVVEIKTDEGITGWGDGYGSSAVCKSIVDTLLKPSVIGSDPFDVEVIWESLYNKVKDYGLAGMTISGISGIDIALWDIIGKACEQPIHKLIGDARI